VRHKSIFVLLYRDECDRFRGARTQPSILDSRYIYTTDRLNPGGLTILFFSQIFFAKKQILQKRVEDFQEPELACSLQRKLYVSCRFFLLGTCRQEEEEETEVAEDESSYTVAAITFVLFCWFFCFFFFGLDS
jgi:hypothetical protein